MTPDGNVTFVKDFFIVGFPGLHPNYYALVSAVMFLVYVCILIANGIFLLLFATNKSLHKPMYFIYVSLVLSDVLFSTCTLPKIIARYWFQAGTISFAACFFQMYLVHYFGVVSSYTLAVMAIDRYIAVCYPFRYHIIMSNRNIIILSVVVWLFSHSCSILLVARASLLPYCGANTIVQCYCDHISITRLACTDRTTYSFPAFVYAMVILLGSLAIIVFSYFCIILAVLQISSAQGRLKTFSTCSSQLIIIALFFLPRCFNYLAANVGITFNADLQIAIIMMYSLLPPMINPLLYSLKTEEVKKILIREFKKDQVSLTLCVRS
ncbi:olfactory receptor 2AT4-like [Pangasianodon hypophthalmus]|uniref:olfactory receptor 2AT4-like n=1 Tax=Pangasianodon hypophthalmus TaxID=310915 RepID=UPI00147A4B9A|nr:olfactory receptor 2AT4-like [Pangasianodon hypophthalmus]